MRIRLAVCVVAGFASLSGLAAVASACYGPQLLISQGSAEGGDPVSFSIAGTDPGATYTITVDGTTVASGTDIGEPGEQASFTMPSCGGSSRPVDVGGQVRHPEDGTATPLLLSGSSAGGLECTVPAPAGEAPDSQAQSQPGVRHAGQPSPRPAKEVVENDRQSPTGSGIAAGTSPAEAVGRDPGPSTPRSGTGGARQPSAESSTNVPDRVLDAVGSTTSVGPAEIPTAGLLALALIFIAGTGMAAFAIYLLQTGPDPRAAIKAPAPLGHDPVEVELQEMIAEEMARKLLSDLELGGSPASSR